MRAESAKHFLHRNSKKSNDFKVCHSITYHLKDALKIVVGRGSGTEPRANVISHRKKLAVQKVISRFDKCLNSIPLQVPTEQSSWRRTVFNNSSPLTR